jgi:hypothetical protein
MTSTDPRRLFVQSEVHRRNGGLHGDLQKFKEFTDKPIVNAKEATEVLVCLSQKSKAKVNEIVDAAVRARVRSNPGQRWITDSCLEGAFKISTARSGR